MQCVNYIEGYGYKIKSDIPGKSPYEIAKRAGIEIPESTKVIVVPEENIGFEYPFSEEKLSPVLTYYIVKDEEEGIKKIRKTFRNRRLGSFSSNTL